MRTDFPGAVDFAGNAGDISIKVHIAAAIDLGRNLPDFPANKFHIATAVYLDICRRCGQGVHLDIA